MSDTDQPPGLYPGEVYDSIAGFPTISHYQPASASRTHGDPRPRLVCVTGALHLARVFYGGHSPHNKPQDFLAHWLSQFGFGVLSLSYPLETDNPRLMPMTAAQFRIEDWGRQAALSTKKVINAHSLPRCVALVSWSMGGRMVVPFNMHVTQLGLDVRQANNLAGSLGISRNIGPSLPGLRCSAAGYLQIPTSLANFCDQLDEMSVLNSAASGGSPYEVIPRHVYLREYVGGTPINLVGLRLKYDRDGGVVGDESTPEEDSQVFEVANFPLISSLHPTSILDAHHALTGRAVWGFLLTYKLEAMIGKSGLRKVQGTAKWPHLMDLVQSAPARLCVPIRGNHFFFVCEQGARETAQTVASLIDEAVELRNELSELLSCLFLSAQLKSSGRQSHVGQRHCRAMVSLATAERLEP